MEIGHEILETKNHYSWIEWFVDMGHPDAELLGLRDKLDRKIPKIFKLN